MWRRCCDRKYVGERLVQLLCILALPVLVNACQTGAGLETQALDTGGSVTAISAPASRADGVPRSRQARTGELAISRRYSNILDQGIAEIDRGRPREASRYFRQAIGVAPQHYLGWLMLGMALLESDADRDAMAVLRKARNLAGRMGQEQAVAEADGHLGFLYYQARSYDLALAALNRSISVMRREKETLSLALNFHRLALVYDKKQMPREALAAARKSVSLFHQLGAAEDTVRPNILIGDILKQRKDLAGAADAYSRVLKYGGGRGNIGYQVLAHIGMGDILLTQGNLARACVHWQVAARLAHARGGLDDLVSVLARHWRDADCEGETGGPLNRPAPLAPDGQEDAA